jgi:hypothetical protein
MKSLITGGILIASLALTGNAAMAANTIHKNAAAVHTSHARAAVHVAARRRPPRAQLNVDIAQFIQSMLGGGLPVQYTRLMQDAMKAAGSHRTSGGSDWSPSYDNSPAVSSGANDSQAAADQEDQKIQSMNDTNAATASNAAAEAANDAANAATLQTEINAGM